MSPGCKAEAEGRVRVVRSRDAQGLCLVAGKPFAAGELIHRWSSRDVRPRPTYQSIQIGPDLHAFDLEVVAYMNHSCDPSTRIDVALFTVVAARPLAPGDELTFFYPSTEWSMDRPFACACGAPACLGYVAGARYLAPEVLDRYFINPHILRLHAEMLFRGLGIGDKQDCRQ